MEVTDKQSTLKLILLGPSNSGKSSLLLRFSADKFIPHRSSYASCLCSREISLNSHKFRVDIWDTGGQERYGTISSLYYRHTNCAVFVYDISSKASFSSLDYWYGQLTTTLYPVQVPFIVIGNKTDLQEDVGWSEGQTWARSRGTQLLMCSAQTGQGVEEAFLEAARLAAFSSDSA